MCEIWLEHPISHAPKHFCVGWTIPQAHRIPQIRPLPSSLWTFHSHRVTWMRIVHCYICCRFYHTLGHYPGPHGITTMGWCTTALGGSRNLAMSRNTLCFTSFPSRVTIRRTHRSVCSRQNRYEPPPEFPLASPYSGIVHHLSGPSICALTQIFPQSIQIGRWCPLRFPPGFTFITPRGFSPEDLRIC